jgi:hypothetical protein
MRIKSLQVGGDSALFLSRSLHFLIDVSNAAARHHSTITMRPAKWPFTTFKKAKD